MTSSTPKIYAYSIGAAQYSITVLPALGRTLVAACICFALMSCSDTQQTPKTIINNVNIVDPVDGLVVQQQVVIEEGNIVFIGPAQGVQASSQDQVLDAAGQFLIPGLWDMHVHFLTTKH